MSWFARSIANTLKLDDDDDEEDNEQYPVNKRANVSTSKNLEQQVDEDNLLLSPGRGVKEDLSEITKTLSRQFWGVASFLAPPLPPGHANEQSESSDLETSAPEPISGIRRDFAEIGGKFRTGISKLSNNIDVSEITKIASNFLQLDSEDEDNDSTEGDGAVGVTDEVVAFARDVAMHPETWLDFPLPEDEDDDEDFELSDAQQEHALAVERLAPRLSALRIELCPSYMSERIFWKIYFVLLHPRLVREAAELLSTPQIVKARASLTHELKNHSYTQSEKEVSKTNSYSENTPLEVSVVDTITPSEPETVKHQIQIDEVQIVDKSVIQEESHKEEDDTDDWLKEESAETVTNNNRVAIPIENNEDISFSDLEDDDGNIPIHYKKPTYGSDSSTKESRSWVQLGRSSTDSGKDSVHNSEMKESNDWLDVVDIDVA